MSGKLNQILLQIHFSGHGYRFSGLVALSKAVRFHKPKNRLHPKTAGFFQNFHFFKNTEKTNKQKIIIIYLTNIAPSGLKYPN